MLKRIEDGDSLKDTVFRWVEEGDGDSDTGSDAKLKKGAESRIKLTGS